MCIVNILMLEKTLNGSFGYCEWNSWWELNSRSWSNGFNI